MCTVKGLLFQNQAALNSGALRQVSIQICKPGGRVDRWLVTHEQAAECENQILASFHVEIMVNMVRLFN